MKRVPPVECLNMLLHLFQQLSLPGGVGAAATEVGLFCSSRGFPSTDGGPRGETTGVMH
jgi:hypothetical protein